MIVNRIFISLFSFSVLISFFLASYIIIPLDYLKNFNIVALRLNEIFYYTQFSNISLNGYVYIFSLFLFIFSLNIFKNIFKVQNEPNKLQIFLLQELKFSTSLIVIFWVLKILDFSRLTLIYSSLLRFLFILLFIKSYNFYKNKFDTREILLINFDLGFKLINEENKNGYIIKKEIKNLENTSINEELTSESYDEVWITGSKNVDINSINSFINKVIEYGLNVKVDNLYDIKTSITPSFEIISDTKFISYSTFYLDSSKYFYKRIFDIMFTITISVILVPISIFASIFIFFDSGFPIIFRQVRGGLNSKKFTIYKFRTMKDGAEKLREDLLDKNDLKGIGFKLHDDPRVTKFGHFLRKYSIDEIPQFINVLKGDMSIVGPRPAVFDEIDRYEIWHRKRLSVRPGITGPWQLTDRLTTDFDERIRLDLNYIENQSFFYDILIILKTPFAIFKHKSA